MEIVDKIKDKFIHICRKLCGYYGLRQKMFDLDDKWLEDYESLESQLEAKILEQDIIGAKLESKILEYDIINGYIKELLKDKYIFLIQELESILGIMKNRGTHPQDLLLKTINEAKRQLKK